MCVGMNTRKIAMVTGLVVLIGAGVCAGLIALAFDLNYFGWPFAVRITNPSPQNITVVVKPDGTILWNGEPVSCPELQAEFWVLAHKHRPRPKLDEWPCDQFPESRKPSSP